MPHDTYAAARNAEYTFPSPLYVSLIAACVDSRVCTKRDGTGGINFCKCGYIKVPSSSVPMQAEIVEGQEQLAKRQRPRRGYCLDVERGAWYEGNVYEQVGTSNFKMQYDGPYQNELNIPPHRLDQALDLID